MDRLVVSCTRLQVRGVPTAVSGSTTRGTLLRKRGMLA